MRWHGGKWKLAPWIIANLPPHRVYVEPFGGAASVLLRKPRSYAEIYNDLDGEVVNLFLVLRDGARSAALIRLLELTPFARTEFNEAYRETTDAIERARRLLVRSFMGFGSDGATGSYRTGFRANSNRSGTTPAHDWANYPAALAILIDRMRGVVVENRDALAVMLAHDGSDTLHYCDPPYLHSTRSRHARRRAERQNDCGVYRHEMSDGDHGALLASLQTLEGMVVISGYPAPVYDDALSGWRRIERAAHADGARDRTEVLWLNPPAWARLRQRQESMFAPKVEHAGE